ncbi:MAG: phage major tail protein, TP901-1 family [Alphaproteobacteria bacterium]
MAGQRGRDVLIKIGDGGSPETFAVAAGIRARSIALAVGLVDATTTDSLGAGRELLGGAGTKKAEVSGAGVFKDAVSDERMAVSDERKRAAYFAGEAATLQLVIPDFGTLQGPFVIAGLAYSGDHDDVCRLGADPVCRG